MTRKTSCKDGATRVGSFALQIIFCLGLREGGGQLPSLLPSNDFPGKLPEGGHEKVVSC